MCTHHIKQSNLLFKVWILLAVNYKFQNIASVSERVLNTLFRAVRKIIDFLQNRLKMKAMNRELTVSYRCHRIEWLREEQTTKETDVDKAEGQNLEK